MTPKRPCPRCGYLLTPHHYGRHLRVCEKIPLDATRRNQYVAPGWTERELKRYMRYWSNLRHVGSIPFDEFAYGGGDPRPQPVGRLLEGLS